MCHLFGFKHSTRHQLRVLAPCAPFLGCYGHVWGWQPEQTGDTGRAETFQSAFIYFSFTVSLHHGPVKFLSLYFIFFFFSTPAVLKRKKTSPIKPRLNGKPVRAVKLSVRTEAKLGKTLRDG